MSILPSCDGLKDGPLPISFLGHRLLECLENTIPHNLLCDFSNKIPYNAMLGVF